MNTVLLSFDIEEFDMPLEYGKNLSFADQIAASVSGTSLVLELLAKHNIKATFFSTVNFANHAGPVIDRIIAEGHELASHGCYHSSFKPEDLLASRLELENISGKIVTGFRMPRMMPVDDQLIEEAGYLYNSSLNPVFIPGRYNNLAKSRTRFMTGKVLNLPASASPTFRLPLFWLSFHNFPLTLYKSLCSNTIQKDGYLNLYFHPWEFTDLQNDAYGLPWYVRKNTGNKMVDRFVQLISWALEQGFVFDRIDRFLKISQR